MKKPRFSTILFVLLLIAGLGVMFYPKMSDLYQRYLLSQEMGRYNQMLADLPSEDGSFDSYWQQAEEYNRWLLTKNVQLSAGQEEVEQVSHLLNPLGNGMMGTIEIPSIDVNLPIYQGTDEQQLQSGAGWWIGSSLPTGGESTHSIITAHTGLVKAALFTDIDKLEIGDTFSLHILDRDLYYEVDQILVTEPIETDPLRIIEGEDHVTLYTCTPYGVNTHRLLVRGVRIDEPEISLVETMKAKARSWWWLALLAGLPILLLLWALMKRRRKKKKSQAAVLPVLMEPAKAEETEKKKVNMIRQIPIKKRKRNLKFMIVSDQSASIRKKKKTKGRVMGSPKQPVPKTLHQVRKKMSKSK